VTRRELAELIGVDDSLLSRRLREGVGFVVETVRYGMGGHPYE